MVQATNKNNEYGIHSIQFFVIFILPLTVKEIQIV